MPTMTHIALSDCSYPESTAYNIRDEINATIKRLKVVIDEEASLRKALRALFVKRREEAIEQVRMANFHLDLVNEEEAAFCDGLMKAATRANEGLQGSGSGDSRKQDETALPTSPSVTHGMTGNHSFSKRLTERGWGGSPPPISPTNSMRGLCDGPPRSPAKSAHQLDSPSPPRSARGLADEPNGTPDRATDDDTYSMLSIRGSTLARHAMSPARSTYALEPPPKTPAYSTRKLDQESSLSPTHSNYGLPSDTPPRSPPRSARGLEDIYLSPFDPNVSSFPEMTPPTQTPVVVEETPRSMDDLFADIMQDVDTKVDDWEFGVREGGENDFDGPVKSPRVYANDYFGQLDSGYHHDDVGVPVGFGEMGDRQDHVQTPPAREPSPIPEPPEEPAFVVPNQKKTKKKKGIESEVVMPPDTELVVEPDLELAQAIFAAESVDTADLGPPEDPPTVFVSHKKKKKGKKHTGSAAVYSLAPGGPIDAEEQAVMEEIKLSEEDKLEAELKQLEAEEAEMAERARLEDARFVAEAAEKERIERERLEVEEILRETAGEEIEHLYYLSLKEASLMAEERLSMVQAELDALEAQKIAILQEAESAREQEASCRYHEILRNKRIGLN